jgi:hypothetical protein
MKDAISERVQLSIPPSISLLALSMVAAVNFNDETPSRG